MIKRRSNRISLKVGIILLTTFALATAGCKQKPQPSPQPQVAPMPVKPSGQPSAGAPVSPAGSTALKPVQAKQSSAKQPATNKPIQSRQSTSSRFSSPAVVNLDFTNRRDPFKPYAQMPAPQQGSQKKPVKGRVADPLPIQKFDSEKFKVTGIITGLKENSALLLDPTGKGFVVKEGMLVGSNDGTVKRITANTVEIEEVFRDDSGKTRKRTVKLTLLRKK